MKKVIKKLNKTLSVLLAAAMIVGSVPDVTLVAQAEEVTEEETLNNETADETPDAEKQEEKKDEPAEGQPAADPEEKEVAEEEEIKNDSQNNEPVVEGENPQEKEEAQNPEEENVDEEVKDLRAAIKTTVTLTAPDGVEVYYATAAAVPEAGSVTTALSAGDTELPYSATDKLYIKLTDASGKYTYTVNDETLAVNTVKEIGTLDTDLTVTVKATAVTHTVAITGTTGVDYATAISTGDVTTEAAAAALTYSTKTDASANLTVNHGSYVIVRVPQDTTVSGTDDEITESSDFVYDYYKVAVDSNESINFTAATTYTVTATNEDDVSVKYAVANSVTDATAAKALFGNNGGTSLGASISGILTNQVVVYQVPKGTKVQAGSPLTDLSGKYTSDDDYDYYWHTITTNVADLTIVVGQFSVTVSGASNVTATLTKGGAPYTSGNQSLKPGDEVVLTITNAVDYDVVVKVDGEPVELSDEGKYTITVGNANVAVVVTETAKYAVTIAGTATSPTVKYSTDKDAAADKYVTLTSGTKLAVGQYYLLITPSGSETIDSVVYGGEVNPTTEAAGIVYKITVSQAENLTINKATSTKVIEIESDANTKAVSYSAASDGTYKPIAKSGNVTLPITIDESSNSAYIKIEPADHYEIDKVYINGSTTAATPVSTDVFKVNAPETGNPKIKITTKRIVDTYTFSKVVGAIVTISQENVILDENQTVADLVLDASDTNCPTNVAIKVNDGDKLYFKIEPIDNAKEIDLTKVKVSNATDTYDYYPEDTYPFSFTANSSKSDFTVVGDLKEITKVAVTISNIDAKVTKIKHYIDANGKAATTATELASAGFGTGVNVLPGQDFTFEISEVAENYAVKKVTYTVDGVTKELNIGNQYTIPNIQKATTITIETDLDAAKKNTATFTFPKEDINSITVSTANATVSSITAEEKSSSVIGTSLAFTVAPKNGYEVDKVTVDGTELTATAVNNYTVDFGNDAKGVTKAVVITVKSTGAAEADQYIAFNKESDNITLAFPTSDKVTYDADKKVYKIAKDVESVEFTATVPYGYKMAPISARYIVPLGSEVSADKKTVVYTYKVVVNQINQTEDATATSNKILLTSSEDTVDISLDGGSNTLTGLKVNGAYIEPAGFATALTGLKKGTEVIFEIKDYETLYITDTDALGNSTKTKVDVDSYNNYKFTVEKAVTFKIENTDAPLDYTVLATLNDAPVDPDEATGSVSSINVKGGDKVVLQVSDNPNIEEIKIDGIKSKITIDNTTNHDITIDVAAEDAGKAIVLPLKTIKDTAGAKKVVTVATVTLNVAPVATTITAKDVVKGVLKMEAGASKELALSITPANADITLFDVSATGKAKAEWKDAAKKDTLVITAASEEDETVVAIKSKDGKTTLLTFTVQTSLPALKLSKLDSASQGMKDVNITMTPNAAIKKVDNLYYEVTVVPEEGTGKPTGSDKKVYYYEVAFDAADKPIASSENVVVNSETDLEKTAWNYNVSVRIVLAKNSVTTATATTALSDSSIAATGNVITKKLATRKGYYEDKLGVIKKTTSIYTGQTAVAAIVKYSKNASFVTNATAQAYKTDGTTAAGIVANVDAVSGQVSVTVGENVAAGKYNIIVFAESETGKADKQPMYQASAKFSITVKPGINNVYEGTIPCKIALVKNKNVTRTVKALGYSGNDTKSASQKFTYEIACDYPKGSAQYNNVMNNVSITKSGKLTVKKDFVLGTNKDNNMFIIKVKAADFANNNASQNFYVEVTGEYQQPGKIAIVKDGKTLGTTLTYEQAQGAEIIVTDKNGETIAANDLVVTPTWTKSAKVWVDEEWNVAGDSVKSKLVINGAPKSVTIKATTKDGGKKSITAKLKLTYSTPNGLTVKATDAYGVASGTGLVEVADNAYEYKATWLPQFKINVFDTDKDGNLIDADKDLYNYTYSISGGKITFTDAYSNYCMITPTAAVTKVTVTDKSKKKNNKIVVTLTNLTFANAKAPSAKLVKGEKLYTAIYNAAGTQVPQTLKYQVSKSGFDAVDLSWESATKYAEAQLAYDTVPVNEKDNTFTLTFNQVSSKTGTVKYTVVYGNYDDDGNFIAATKPATLSVKINKQSTFKPATKYVLNVKDSTKITFTGKPANVPVVVNEVQNANIKGKANKFADYFEATTPASNKFQLKAGADLTKLTAEDLTGYIKYTYALTTGGTVTNTVKVTVTLDNVDKSYSVETEDVMKANTIKTAGVVTLNDVKVNIKDIKTVTSGWTVKKAISGEVGAIELVSTSAVVGQNTVEFKMITADSAYANETDIDKYGVTVTAIVTVVDPATGTGLINVNDKNTVVDLNADTTIQSWNAKDNTGVYTSAAATVVGKDKILTYAINGITVKGMALAQGAPEGITLSYNAGKVNFSATANKITAGKSITVPVEVSFLECTAKETINFTIKTPDVIKGLSEVAADVEKYLAAYISSGVEGTDQTAISDALSNNGLKSIVREASGVVVQSVTCKHTAATTTTPASYTASVTLTSKADAKAKVELKDKALLPPTTVVKQTNIDMAWAAVIAKLAYVYDEGETIPEAVKTSGDYLEAKASTTRFEIRQYLQKAINNDEYMLSITDYVKVPAKVGVPGSITFKLGVVSRTEGSRGTVTVKLTLKALTAPTP